MAIATRTSQGKVLSPARTSGASTRKTLSCLFQMALMVVTLLFVLTIGNGSSWDSFIFWCRYGTVAAIAALVLYSFEVGKFLTPMMLVMISFVVFQFGIPILYGFAANYSNYYAGFLNASLLTTGAAFTVVCIQAFVLGASLARRTCVPKPRDRRGSFFEKPFLRDSESVTQIAGIGFVLTGLVAIPRALMFFLTSLASGIGAARATYELGGIENIARGFFVPLGLLLLVYLPRGRRRNLVFAVLFVYSALAALSGDRTEGLTLMVALIYFMFGFGSGKAHKTSRTIGLVAGLLIVVWLLVFVANTRVGGSGSGITLGDALVSALNEMGFNALTIDYEIANAPKTTYGLSYLAALTSLIPNSLDFAGVKDALDFLNPTSNYYTTMGYQYNWATFGLGYSLIAESYVNFGYCGFLAIGVIGAIMERLMSWGGDTPFERYLSLVFLWSFLTLPRRQMTWLVNAFEYDLLFVLLILWVWYSLVVTHRSGSKQYSSAREGGEAL